MPDTLRHHLEIHAHDILRQLEPDDERYNEIPPEYCAAFPLDSAIHATQITGSFGYPSSLYKVVDRRSGLPYALRRVDGARVSHKVIELIDFAMKNIEQVAASVQGNWRAVCHSNIIHLRRSFVHGGATYFAHEYWPGAKSLLEYHFISPIRGILSACLHQTVPQFEIIVVHRCIIHRRVALMELYSAAYHCYTNHTCCCIGAFRKHQYFREETF